MPLFFYISGYLFVIKIRNDIVSDFIYKGKRLLVPYFIFSTIAYFLKWPLSIYSQRPVDLGFSDFFYRLIYPWENPVIFYWFLPTIFIITIFSSFLLRFSITLSKINFFKIENKNKFNIIFLLLSFIFAFYTSSGLDYRSPFPDILNTVGILYHFPFFLLGCILSLVGRKKINMMSMLKGLFLLLSFCFIFDSSKRSLAIIIILSLHSCSILISSKFLFFSNFIFGYYRYNMSIYLLSFFFQVPIGFLVFHYTSSPLQMLIFSFIFGFIGPIITVKLISKSFTGRKVIKFLGI